MDYYVLWLITLEINNEQKIKLIEKYKSAKAIKEDFYNILTNEISIRKPLNLKQSETKIEQLKDYMIKNNIKYITCDMEEYPELLKEIVDYPYVLFYKGDIEILKEYSVAIVGGRKHTIYGEKATRFIVREAVRHGVCIVSGGATGIDSIAHDEALKNNGKTVVVLGCGVDVVYPKKNKRLFEEVEKYGVIISEFLPTTEPFAYNFPRRNRIISGLTNKLIVTEANAKSGSLITVGHALDQGRGVGVVPASIFSELGRGCNMLMREGAEMILSKEELLEFLNVSQDAITSNNSIIQNEILNIIRDEPMHIDKIFEKSQVDRNTLYRLLFEMQIKNEVVSLPGNYYARII